MKKRFFLKCLLAVIFCVVSVCVFADSITQFPWVETFATTPANWTRWTGNLTNYSILSQHTGSWIDQNHYDLRNFGNNANHANGQATSIMLQSPRNVWLVTPTIILPSSGEHIFTFDIAHTHVDNTWSSSPPRENFFAVIISTDNGQTWSVENTLARWDQRGSVRSVASIPNTGETVILDLNDYSGAVKIAFYAEVVQNGGRIHIDNVAVRQTVAPTTVEVVTPPQAEFVPIPAPPPPVEIPVSQPEVTPPPAVTPETLPPPLPPQGLSNILVLPTTTAGADPLEVPRSNQPIRQTATYIERNLTSLQYQLILPQSSQYQSVLNELQTRIGNNPDERTMRLALANGSDIYLIFEQQFSNIANETRFSFTIRAFESTSGRLLATETRNAQGPQSDSVRLVENTVNDVITDLMRTVVNNWTQGKAYRLIIGINSMYREDEARTIHTNFDRVIREITTSVNRNSATTQQMDYTVWCDPHTYADADSFFRELKARYDRAAFRPALNSENLSRKVLMLKID